MNKQISGKIAFCGIAAALSLAILLMTIVPITEISLAALAGIIGIPVVIEFGRKYGLAVYAVVSVLSLLLIPTPEGKVLYIGFFGYYPALKSVLETRRLPRLAEWGLKLAVFNTAVLAAYWLMLQLFGLPKDSFTLGGVSLPWLFLLFGNVVFFVYDWCLTGLISKYMTAWRPLVHRLFRF